MDLVNSLIAAIGYIFAFSTGYFIGLGRDKKDRVKKKVKMEVCPHGKITKQEIRLIEGKEALLCDFCFKKRGVGYVSNNDLPRL